MNIQEVYRKFRRYIPILSNNKLTKRNSKYYPVCSRFELYIQDAWNDDKVLMDVRYKCISSLLLITYVDILLNLCIGKTKEDIIRIITNMEDLNEDYIRDLNGTNTHDREITKLKTSLIKWLVAI